MKLPFFIMLHLLCQGTCREECQRSTICQKLSHEVNQSYLTSQLIPRPSSEELDEALKDVRKATDIYYLWVMMLLVEELEDGANVHGFQASLKILSSAWFSMDFQEQLEAFQGILQPSRFARLRNANMELPEFHRTLKEFSRQARARSEAILQRKPRTTKGTLSLGHPTSQVRETRTETWTRAPDLILREERHSVVANMLAYHWESVKAEPGTKHMSSWSHYRANYVSPPKFSNTSRAQIPGHPHRLSWHISSEVLAGKRWRSRGWCRKLPSNRWHRFNKDQRHTST